MRNFRLKSRWSKSNLFADFICQKIGMNIKSIIQVADCDNFLVVRGLTESKEILDLNEIKESFLTKFNFFVNEKKLLNTIDLIDYGVKLETPNKKSLHFFNTKSCSISPMEIEFLENEKNKADEELIISSSFPFGYSWEMGRKLYYYGKHIVYNLPTETLFTEIHLTIPSENPELNFEIDGELKYPIDSLKSAILDCFDFNFDWMENEIKKVDLNDEITNPLEDHPFLKNKVKNFILI